MKIKLKEDFLFLARFGLYMIGYGTRKVKTIKKENLDPLVAGIHYLFPRAGSKV